jgi:hypothetical protein
LDIVQSPRRTDIKLDASHWMGKGDDAVSKRRQDMMTVMEFHTGVSLGILFPFTPISQLYHGDDPEYVAAQSTASALETWLMLSALGGAESGAVTAARMKVVMPAVRTAVAPALPAAVAYKGATEYIEAIAEYEPEGNVHDKSSFWSSISAAMAGTFGGMPYAGNY